MPALVALTILVLAASVVLTRGQKSRAEGVIAATLVANAIVIVPIYVLGFANILDRVSLSVLVGGFSTLVLARVVWLEGAAGMVALAWRCLAFVRLPFEGIARTWRKRSLLTVVAVVATIAFPYFLLVAYLAPAWRDWDALWYHEPIVAYTIQNRGFAPVPLPASLQNINGVHRLAEMTQLWFAIFAGRRVVDIANVFFMPLLAASMFALARRFTRDAVTAVAWASALVLFPGFARIVQSCMVDPQNAALTLAAAYWVTHPKLDARGAIYAILALTLAAGSKIWSIVGVGILSLVLLGRLLARAGALGWPKTLGLIGLGTASIAGIEATVFVRNLVLFKNPVWPILGYHNARLGIHWQGVYSAEDLAKLNLGDPFPLLYEKMLALPYKHFGPGHTWQLNDYGFAYAWIVFPLIAIVLFALAASWLGALLAVRLRLRARAPADADTNAAMILAVAGVAPMVLSPSLHIPRYHVASIGMFVACMCWAAARIRSARFVEDAALIAALGSFLMAMWGPAVNTHAFVYPPKVIWDWMKTPYPKREVIEPALTPHVAVTTVVPETGIVRDRDMKAGDVLAFDHIDYLATLWNVDYSNKVVWVADAPDPLAEADRIGATWAYAHGGPGSAFGARLVGSGRWELVGPLEAERFGSLYRRKR
jgi:hypothetical protein